MKWKTTSEPVGPEQGAIRYSTAFAIIPHDASDGYTYWLERVFVRERYMKDGYVSGRSYWWIAEWIGNKAPEYEHNSPLSS